MEKLNTEKENTNISAVATAPEVSLENAKSILEKQDTNIEKKKAKIEKKLLQNEEAGKERSEASIAKLQANNEKAKQTASEALLIAEYSGEYQRRLAKAQNRQKQKELLEKQERALLAEKEKKEARQSEIDEFLRRESEEQSAREGRALSMLEKLNSLYEKGGEKELEKSEITEEINEKIDTPTPVSEQNEDSAEDLQTQNEEKSQDDELVLKIGYNRPMDEDELTIRIGAFSVPSPRPEVEAINEEIRIAEQRHSELRRNAVICANGVFEEEKRLLRDEDTRYAEEIAELRARLDELSLRQDNFEPAMQTFVSTVPVDFQGSEADLHYEDIDALNRELGEKAEKRRSYGISKAYLDSELIDSFERYQEKSSRQESKESPELDEKPEKRAADGISRAYLDSELIESFERYQEKNNRSNRKESKKSPELSDAFLYPEKERKRVREDGEYNEQIFDQEYLRHYDDAQAEEYTREHAISYAESYPKMRDTVSYESRYDEYAPQPIEPPIYEESYFSYEPWENPPPQKAVPKKRVSDTNLYDEKRDISAYHTDELDTFKRAELISRLDEFYKQEKLAEKKISKLEASQKNAEKEKNIALIVEKIGVEKEITEFAVEALSSAAYADVRSRISRQKKSLERHIERYNLFCDEYETATGRPLDRLPRSMVSDAMAGRICKPIPNVYYGGDDTTLDELSDRAHRLHYEESVLHREYDRYLEDGARAEFLPESERPRQKSDRMSKIRYATERDVLLIGLRSEYRLASLEARRDVLTHSFGSDTKKLTELEKIDAKIEKVRKSVDRALKIERGDNARYYMLPLLDPIDEKTKKRARRERLNALRVRLNVLLAEREDINERLIALYGGSDKKLGKVELNRKAGIVRRKSAKAMRRRQHQIAKIINKYKAPHSMKEEAYELLNNKIALVALAEETRYKLKKEGAVGNLRRELLRTLRKTRRDIKRNDKEITFMIKRIKTYEARLQDKKDWAKIMLMTFGVVAIVFGAVFIWGENVIAYFTDLISKFKK